MKSAAARRGGFRRGSYSAMVSGVSGKGMHSLRQEGRHTQWLRLPCPPQWRQGRAWTRKVQRGRFGIEPEVGPEVEAWTWWTFHV